MPRGAKPGERRGGRTKGVPNKRTFEIEAMLEAKGCNPLEGLASIAMGEPMLCMVGLNKEVGDIIEEMVRPTLDQRLTALKELAQYVAPKRKAIEHAGGTDSKLTVTWEGAESE